MERMGKKTLSERELGYLQGLWQAGFSKESLMDKGNISRPTLNSYIKNGFKVKSKKGKSGRKKVITQFEGKKIVDSIKAKPHLRYS
jgi:hypothetical protein